jgi:hypothetical protein
MIGQDKKVSSTDRWPLSFFPSISDNDNKDAFFHTIGCHFNKPLHHDIFLGIFIQFQLILNRFNC